jgi:hypothetical protein
MYLGPHDGMLDDQALPFRIDSRGVGQDCEKALNLLHLGEGGRYREAKSVVFEGPGSDVPELRNILAFFGV